MRQDLHKDYEQYAKRYVEDPFASDTIEMGEQLLENIGTSRRDEWIKTIEDLENSHKVWKLLRQLNNEKPQSTEFLNITANQIAHTLIMNNKTVRIRTHTKIVREKEDTENLKSPLSMEELDSEIKTMKCKKAARVDGLMTEQIKQFGHKTREWILRLFNDSIQNETIPNIWLKTKVIAFLKPGKYPINARNFRPVSLLCHMYKLFERMIVNRIKHGIEKKN